MSPSSDYADTSLTTAAMLKQNISLESGSVSVTASTNAVQRKAFPYLGALR